MNTYDLGTKSILYSIKENYMKHEVYLPECYSEINEFIIIFIMGRNDKLTIRVDNLYFH